MFCIARESLMYQWVLTGSFFVFALAVGYLTGFLVQRLRARG